MMSLPAPPTMMSSPAPPLKVCAWPPTLLSDMKSANWVPVIVVENVVAAVAGDDVGERVAGAGERQVLDIVRQRVVGERRQDRVVALVGVLRHHVADVVDDIGVVAKAAGHRVGAGAAVEPVVAAVARER